MLAPPLPPSRLTKGEIEEIGRQLSGDMTKVAPGDALRALVKLMAHPMDLETLKATKIGVSVNPYRKHEQKKVAHYAKEIVGRWKKLVPA